MLMGLNPQQIEDAPADFFSGSGEFVYKKNHTTHHFYDDGFYYSVYSETCEVQEDYWSDCLKVTIGKYGINEGVADVVRHTVCSSSGPPDRPNRGMNKQVENEKFPVAELLKGKAASN